MEVSKTKGTLVRSLSERWPPVFDQLHAEEEHNKPPFLPKNPQANVHIKERSMEGISLNEWVLTHSNDQMLASIFIHFPNVLISYKNRAD